MILNSLYLSQVRSTQQLNSSLPRSISAGLSAVEQIASELELSGYYGPVIDNFELKNEAFRVAVEVVAGNSLFNVIGKLSVLSSICMSVINPPSLHRSEQLYYLSLSVSLVDTDATAAVLIKELDRRAMGRLTFLPLNRLKKLNASNIKYPDSNEVRSLVEVAINYEPEFEVS